MMEELNILEAGTEERKVQLHIVVKLFCLLLLMALLSDPTFTRSAERFFDLLLVPVSESGNVIYIKNKEKMPDVAKTAKSASKEIKFSNSAPAIDKTSLLTEVAITNHSLMLEKDLQPDPTEGVQTLSMFATVDENSMSASLPQNPLPEPAVSEITVSDPALQDSIVPSIDPKLPSDGEIYTDTKHAADTEIQADENISSDIRNDPPITAPGIQDSAEISAENATWQDPVIQKPLPDGPQTSGESIADSLVSEESSAPAPTPEMTETDSVVSDVTAPSDIEDIENGPGETIVEAPSCFLLDENGMLYGFLPEYAEISDGCLTLPAECTGIRSGAFSGRGSDVLELYIPSGVTMIEDGAFIGLDSLVWIDIEGANPVYTSINGVLFDNTTTRLLSFPAGRTDAYSIPGHVTQIAAGAFTNTSLTRLDFRRCSSLFLEGNIFGGLTGSGIVIAVPAESLAVYEEIFSSYAVALTI